MGLFDFAKDIGKKLFNNDADAAAKITEHILSNNPGLDDLSVIFKDGQATLIAVTNSAKAAQIAILMAGNVEGVTEVIPKIDIIDIETDVGTALEPENVEFYVIQSGDSLSKIAKKYYQDAMEYPRIFAANKEVILDPDLIYPGQKIRIPMD
jgi:nucleoid-associated protein YgaU